MMRHFSKSHGSHCYLRSFQTKCSKCGMDVLYWECTHGCKIFFDYPPYGKLIKHFCRKRFGENQKNNNRIIVKTPTILLENSSPSCPVCGKFFKNEKNLNNHLSSLKDLDYHHTLFFDNKILFTNDDRMHEQTKLQDFFKKKERFENKPKFGRINIKKKEN